jgi:aminopeptidase YwaD
MKLTHTFLFSLLLSSGIYAQTHNDYHQSLVNQVNAASMETNLTSFVGFGEKELGSTAGMNAFNWLKSLYESWGYTLIEQQTVSAWGETGYNLIVTKTGTTYPNTYIIVDAHYDTINGPGANDNGSGTTILLEMARILKDVPTEYSIKFIHFTAEEWGLIGSQKYVDEIAVPQNLDIKLVLNIDQVGGVEGEVNNKIVCERDQDSPNSNNNASQMATTELSNLMGLYSTLQTTIDRAYGSDYMPFQDAGYVITGLYEFNESPYPHSPQDTMNHVDLDFLFQVAKGSLGAVCYFAKAYEEMGISSQSTQNVRITPNPAQNFVQIEHNFAGNVQILLTDLNGKTVLTQEFARNKIQLNTTDVPNGIYLLHLIQNENRSHHKLIIQHK